MNRLQSPSPELLTAPLASRTSVESVQCQMARCEAAETASPCALFAPLHYEPKYAYPLIVWLHGPRDNEQQLRRIMPLISMRNYVSAAPRGTRADDSTGAAAGAFGWAQTHREIELAEQRVFDAIEAAEARFHVGPQRVFLAGFDCGGTMALRIALSAPEKFAGVLSLGGGLPSGHAPLSRVQVARRLPVLMICCAQSHTYPTERVCADLRLFHAAGFEVSLRQYPCGQELTTLMLSDVDRWIMERIGGSF